MCLGATGNCEGVGEAEKLPRVCKRSGNATTGWKVSGHPLVVGVLKSLACFREELTKTHLLTKQEIFMVRNCLF